MTEPTEPAEAERREDDRAAIKLKVDYKRLNTFFADYTKNISKGGTFIRTDTPLDVGTTFVFVLTVPEPSFDNAPVSLELTGQVKWTVVTSDATPDSPAGMGIQFVFKDDTERARVETFVADLMRTSLGDQIADAFLGRPRT
jgi:type IV pilus assembly protein PilZ